MATPTPGKTGPSQQGRTPQPHGASPPVSTPFSLTGAQVFSPRGPRSSPQQVKKSPANSATLAGHPSAPPMNFDSPTAAAAMGSLGMPGGLDIGLENVGVGGLGGYGLGVMGGEDERLKRLDAVIGVLSVGFLPVLRILLPEGGLLAYWLGNSIRRDTSATRVSRDWCSG